MKRIISKVITIAIAVAMLMLVACTPKTPEYERVQVLLWKPELGKYSYDDVADSNFELQVPVFYMEVGDSRYRLVGYIVTYTREIGSSEYTVSEEIIHYEYEELFEIEGLDKVHMDKNDIVVNDNQDPLINDTITMIYRPDPSLRRVFNIRKDPIPEEEMWIDVRGSNDIRPNTSRTLFSNMLPSNASYRDVWWEIERIELGGGGTVYGEDISKYAEFGYELTSSVILTTYNIPIYSKIHVKATSEYVGLVDRAVLDVHIVETDMWISAQWNNDAYPNSQKWLSIGMLPSNATYKQAYWEIESIELGGDGGTVYGDDIAKYAEFDKVLSESTILSIYDIPIGSKMHVKATSYYVGLVARVEILIVS